MPLVLHRISIHELFAAEKISVALLQAKALLPFEPTECIVVCVGSDRSTGDCLGPLVGTGLLKQPRPGLRVYGTLDEPVHAGNLQAVIEGLSAALPGCGACDGEAFEADGDVMAPTKKRIPLIIGVDASLGHSNHVGTVAVGTGPLRPGAGVQKALPEIGHLFLTGTVNVGGFMDYMVLQNTRLSVVMKMADTMARGLLLALPRLYKYPR
ncbi:MAG TPA: spore protease YyaC [Clostridia bacterium]|nr:spore protease YyaC [Clostridia bacterium]